MRSPAPSPTRHTAAHRHRTRHLPLTRRTPGPAPTPRSPRATAATAGNHDGGYGNGGYGGGEGELNHHRRGGQRPARPDRTGLCARGLRSTAGPRTPTPTRLTRTTGPGTGSQHPAPQRTPLRGGTFCVAPRSGAPSRPVLRGLDEACHMGHTAPYFRTGFIHVHTVHTSSATQLTLTCQMAQHGTASPAQEVWVAAVTKSVQPSASS